MLVVEVDHVGPEAPQAGVAGLMDVFGAAVHAIAETRADGSELGRQYESVPLRAEDFAQELLVVARAIDIRRIEEIDAMFQRAPQHGARFVDLRRAVEPRDA